MLKRYIKSLFCKHSFITSYEPYYNKEGKLGITKENIVCVKCGKQVLNNYIEVK